MGDKKKIKLTPTQKVVMEADRRVYSNQKLMGDNPGTKAREKRAKTHSNRESVKVTVKNRKTGKINEDKTEDVNLSNKFLRSVEHLGKTKRGRAALRAPMPPMKSKLGQSLQRTKRAAAKIGERKK